VPISDRQCDYCGSWFADEGRIRQQVRRKPSLTPEQLRAADFGVKGSGTILVCFLGAVIIYAVGWYFEDLVYWLDTTAVVIWAIVLPVWMLVFSYTWRASKGQWYPGLIFSIPLFLIHLSIMWAVDRHIYDDSVGISAEFAGAALGGWILGRVLHIITQRARARNK
jgi:hypothetical protein